MRPAVFLDRDGTMIQDVGYLSRREDLQWFSWTIDAIRLLNRAGFVVCVTTNQGGVGLGFYEEQFVKDLHREMSETIAAAGGRVDGWYYCPHYPTAVIDALRMDCDCRKPKPGMIHQATSDFAIDLERSYVVGDKIGDVGLAAAVGAKGVLVRTGFGELELRRRDGAVPGATHVAPTLAEAAAWILLDAGFPKERA
ncbi:MAG TPA: HAD family hydrolase [Vicinamibacterales bacterium]|nr:HAD family hydrolase [Vicinamibacterales bacterium]